MRRRRQRQRPLKPDECAGVSLRPVLCAFVVDGSGRFHASANSKGEVLPRAHALLPGNHEAGNDAESDLRKDKPGPVDALVEHWINDSKNAVNQTSPQDGRDEASHQNRAARKHGKHRAVEKPDNQKVHQGTGPATLKEIPSKSPNSPGRISSRTKPL